MPHKDKIVRNNYQRQSMERLRIERRTWLDSLKENIPCKRCEQIYPPYVMDWHHRDPSLKSFQISRAIHITSTAKILTEIAKCDLYCANCHRIIEHAGS